jgi:5-methylcytosine-specific restriction protein A
MTRRMSPTRRARIFSAHDGKCHICGGQIDGTRERWDVEHIIPLEISRDDDDNNLAPAHVSCHKAKTKQDAADIAKCKRVERKHNGAHRARSIIPGSRDSKWKRKIGGGVEPR